MNSSDSIKDSSNANCKYDIKCKKSVTNHCQGCGEMFCKDHYLEHRKKLQEQFKNIMSELDLLKQKWKSLTSDMSTDIALDRINEIYEYSLKSDQVEKTATMVQQQLQNLINEKKQSVIMISKSKFDQNDYLENVIEQLKENIEELKLKLEEINNEQSQTIESLSINNNSKKEKYPVKLYVNNSRKNITDNTPALSDLVIKRSSSSNLDVEENETVSTETHLEEEEEEDHNDDGEEMVVFLNSNTELQINHKVRFSNNIVRWLRGPFKTMVKGLMSSVDLCAQGTHISEYVLEAVKKGLAKQNQNSKKQQITNNSIKPTFTEITSDWKLEESNSNEGYSSASLWMRNPQGQRVLIKIQQLALCAANEWLAYVLGKELGLPVNEVQIAIYENKLATLHTDAQDEGEKTLTLLELPKNKRKILLTYPIMEQMDIFDHIIQNADRNQQNILITIPETDDITNDNDDSMKGKIYLIDHASSFGMGQVSGINTMASKFHTNRFSVVKFDPVQKSKKFEEYLNKLPVEDRPIISEILSRFASVTDDQFDSWITEMQDFLSVGQYNRIYSVLRRQRDIAKRYAAQWNISSTSLSTKSNKTDEK
ncbi:unnamed protein product [Adineta steineri]|uniref:Uncharacterized protein n=1 Tax=Adineta steineri TaxID=433720 RepID=A0A819LHP5_9BILA|nr:unnamed protein product [Adineta steineri]CAF3961164.1 unnamed protein product [Adineta steineri]